MPVYFLRKFNLKATLPKYYIFGKLLNRRFQKVTPAVYQMSNYSYELAICF